MDAYGGTIAHYSHPGAWPRQEEELWSAMMQTNPLPFPVGNNIFPMQRYLHSADQPWFTHASFAEYPQDPGYQLLHANASIAWPQEPAAHPIPLPQRYTSPSAGGPSPPSISNSWSDGQSTAWSPTPSTPHQSPELTRRASLCLSFGGSSKVKQEAPCAGEPCVALNEIQQYADAVTDEDALEAEPSPYLVYGVQEGYQPIQSEHEPINEVSDQSDPPQHYCESDDKPVIAPRFRRRNVHESRAATTPHNASKVGKRSSRKKRSIKRDPDETPHKRHVDCSRAFPCPFARYGCPASFGSKNEWKRHINTQHMRLNYWRCDLCDQTSRRPNDFNRKDLFIQHVRRMHPAPKPTTPNPSSNKCKSFNSRPPKNDPYEVALVETAGRCLKTTRPPPHCTACLFCEEKFVGAGGWEERLEHIGRHMEFAKKMGEVDDLDWRRWISDPDLEGWLVRQGIIVDAGRGYLLLEGW